jgi:hypothetical protein
MRGENIGVVTQEAADRKKERVSPVVAHKELRF